MMSISVCFGKLFIFTVVVVINACLLFNPACEAASIADYGLKGILLCCLIQRSQMRKKSEVVMCWFFQQPVTTIINLTTSCCITTYPSFHAAPLFSALLCSPDTLHTLHKQLPIKATLQFPLFLPLPPSLVCPARLTSFSLSHFFPCCPLLLTQPTSNPVTGKWASTIGNNPACHFLTLCYLLC